MPGLMRNLVQLGRALRLSHPPPPSEGKLLRPLQNGEEGSVAAAAVLPAFLVEGDADAAEALAPYLAAAE